MNTNVKQNQKTKEPARLTQTEKQLLKKCINVHDWHFKKLFQDNCIEISTDYITWEDSFDKKGREPVKSFIYGLEGMYADSKQAKISNFFIFLNYKVYQEWSIEKALMIQGLLKKEYLRNQYEDKLLDAKYEEKQKKLKAA